MLTLATRLEPAGARGAVDLAALVDLLGDAVAGVVSAGSLEGRRPRRVILLEAGDQYPLSADDLILVAGNPATQDSGWLEQVSRAGVAGVIFRHQPDSWAALCSWAGRAGVALIGIRSALGWNDVLRLAEELLRDTADAAWPSPLADGALAIERALVDCLVGGRLVAHAWERLALGAGVIVVGYRPGDGFTPAARPSFHRRLPAIAIGDVLIELWCVGSHESSSCLRPAVEQLLRSAGRAPVANAAISAPLVGPDQVAEAVPEVIRVLQLGGDAPLGTVTTVAEARTALRLRDLQSRLRELGGGGAAAALRAQDQRNGGTLVASVRAYLDCLGDVLAASRRLSVHPNTLRYRLRRVESVAGDVLNSPDERLLLHLELRAP